MAKFKRSNLFQMRLLPSDIRDWIPDNNLILFLYAITDQLNLDKFYAKFRRDNWGGIGYDPRVLLTIIMMGYCLGKRESRQIEELCKFDVRFRLILGETTPDHSTICRFIQKFQEEIAELFDQVTNILLEANIINTDIFALDGTKLRANASLSSNHKYKKILLKMAELQEIIAEYHKNSVEFPNCDQRLSGLQISKKVEQLSRLEQAKEIIENQHKKTYDEYQEKNTVRANFEKKSGKKIRGRKLTPVSKETNPNLRCNTSDPESLIQKGKTCFIQGFNAQVVVSVNHYILAADVVPDQNDLCQLSPMVSYVIESLARNDISPISVILLADAGYCVYQSMPEIFAEGLDLYIPSQKEWKLQSSSSNEQFILELGDIPQFGLDGKTALVLATYGEFVFREWIEEDQDWNYNGVIHDIMAAKISSPSGREKYRKRKWIVESIFGYLKEAKKFLAFLRRGLDACKSEWKLICMCYNLNRAWKQGLSNLLIAE